MTKVTSHKACMALEGSVPGDEGMRSIYDYADEVYRQHSEEWRASGQEGVDLAFFFAYLRQAANVEGDSRFRLKIERRNPKSKRTPEQDREWENRHVPVALLIAMKVDQDIAEGKKGTKESWIEKFIALENLTRSEIFEAEKTPLFQRLRDSVKGV